MILSQMNNRRTIVSQMNYRHMILSHRNIFNILNSIILNIFRLHKLVMTIEYTFNPIGVQHILAKTCVHTLYAAVLVLKKLLNI